MRILLFKSKLAALLVSMAALLAVPAVGAIAIAYTILPDIGVFSDLQKAVIWIYGISCLLVMFYAYVATRSFLNEAWQEYAVPGYRQAKYYLNLMFLPVIGSFFMLYLYFEPCLKVGGTVKRLCGILITGTIVDIVLLAILFLGKAGFEWLLLVAGLFCIFHYILLITIACKLTKDPIGRPAKVIITILLISFFGAVGFMASSTWIIDSQIAKAEKELADIYGRPMTGNELRKIYYHGLKPNCTKFEKILPHDPEDEENFFSLPVIPEKLSCFFIPSLTNKKLDRELSEWIKTEKTFFHDFDRIIKNEKYLKMSEKIRNYDDELLVNIFLPQMNHLRNWARVLKMRARNALINNNTRVALDRAKQIGRIRDYASDDHFLISYLVAVLLESIRFNTLALVLGQGDFSEKQILNIVKYINESDINWDKSYKIAMYSNAVVELNVLNYVIRDLDSNIHSKSNTGLRRNGIIYQFILGPIHWKIYNKMLQALKLLKIRAIFNNRSVKEIPNITFEDIHFYIIKSKAVNKVWDKTQEIKNQKVMLITALQIELYKKKYHKLPDKLNDLVPEFAPRVPIDLLSGEPLKYIHGEIILLLTDARVKYSEGDDLVPVKVNGYRIYSVGFNKKDDRGFQGYLNRKYYDDIGFSVINNVVKSKPEL